MGTTLQVEGRAAPAAGGKDRRLVQMRTFSCRGCYFLCETGSAVWEAASRMARMMSPGVCALVEPLPGGWAAPSDSLLPTTVWQTNGYPLGR